VTNILTDGNHLRDPVARCLPACYLRFLLHSAVTAACGAAPNHWLEGFFMGKYVVGWLLGVPVVVLVVIYLIFH
jgi:hypothetical protein